MKKNAPNRNAMPSILAQKSLEGSHLFLNKARTDNEREDKKPDDKDAPKPDTPPNDKPEGLSRIPKKILDRLGDSAKNKLPEMLKNGLAKFSDGKLIFGGAALLGKNIIDKTLQFWQRYSNCGLEAGCNLKKVFLMSEAYAKAEKEKPGSGDEAVKKLQEDGKLDKNKWAQWGMKNLKHNSGGMTYDGQQAWNMKNKLKINGSSKGFVKVDRQKLVDLFAEGRLLQRNGHGHSWSYSGMRIGDDGKVELLRTDSSYRNRRSQWESINKVFFGRDKLYGLFTKSLDTVV